MLMISPALFVPLIENAFKYASFRNKKPCIDIQLSADNGIVDFEISNIYESNFRDSKAGSFGIWNNKSQEKT